MIYNKNKPISLYCRWLGIYMLCVILGAMGLGSIGSLLKILGFVPVVIWIFEKHAFYKNKVIYFAILFVLWSSASLFWSINLSASVSRAVTQVSFLVMLLSAAGYSYSGEEITYLKNCLVWSTRLTAVVVLLTGTHSAGRLLLSGTINENPNYLCAYFLAAVVNGGIIILQKRSSLILKILSVVEIAVYIYITFATGSRGGLLSVVIAGIIVILLYKDNGGSQGLSILKKVGITILVMIVFGIVL